jgi:hypothetical protein
MPPKYEEMLVFKQLFVFFKVCCSVVKNLLLLNKIIIKQKYFLSFDSLEEWVQSGNTKGEVPLYH